MSPGQQLQRPLDALLRGKVLERLVDACEPGAIVL
jgi:hypothetical protein